MNKRFESIIIKCQELRKKHGFDYTENCRKQIEKYTDEIISKKLIDKCDDKYFAMQLCVMNSLCMEHLIK